MRMSGRAVLGAVMACGLGVGCSQPQATAAPAAAAPAEFALAGTQVLEAPSALLKRHYRIYVSLPKSYGTDPARRYPVVFVTDADTQFPLIRSIARRLGHSERHVEEFILVGLSYGVGETPEYSRRRDYTNSPHGPRGSVSDMPGREPVFGQAEAYRRYLKSEVFPLVAARFQADMERKVFVGQSYGGLLGAHVLLTEPEMFQHYVIGSPSLWFGGRITFAREIEYAKAHRDLKAKVFLAVGGYETLKPGGGWRYNTEADMVGDMRALTALRARGYPGLTLEAQVLEDEDHLTAFPAVVTRGLMWSLPGKG